MDKLRSSVDTQTIKLYGSDRASQKASEALLETSKGEYSKFDQWRRDSLYYLKETVASNAQQLIIQKANQFKDWAKDKLFGKKDAGLPSTITELLKLYGKTQEQINIGTKKQGIFEYAKGFAIQGNLDRSIKSARLDTYVNRMGGESGAIDLNSVLKAMRENSDDLMASAIAQAPTRGSKSDKDKAINKRFEEMFSDRVKNWVKDSFGLDVFKDKEIWKIGHKKNFFQKALSSVSEFVGGLPDWMKDLGKIGLGYAANALAPGAGTMLGGLLDKAEKSDGIIGALAQGTVTRNCRSYASGF